MMLTILILLPLLTALILAMSNAKASRTVALAGSGIQLLFSLLLLQNYLTERAAGNTALFLFESSSAWFPALNINFHIGVDGISIAMILLTASVVFAGVLVSWKIEKMTKEFFLLLIILSACLLYTSPSPRDRTRSRMPSSA